MELDKGTSSHMNVANKKIIFHIILKLYTRESKFKFNIPTQAFASTFTQSHSLKWPDDIASISDLNSTVSGLSLREDVEDFLWKTAKSIVTTTESIKLHYRGDCIGSTIMPILMEIPSEHVSNLKGLLQIAAENVNELTPMDLVEVVAISSSYHYYNNQ